MKIKNVIKNTVEKIKDVAEDIKEEISDLEQKIDSNKLTLDYDNKKNVIGYIPLILNPTSFVFGSILPMVFPKIPVTFPLWNKPPVLFPFDYNIPLKDIDDKKADDVSNGTWSYDSDTTAWSFSSSDSSVVYSITGLPDSVNEENIDRKVFYDSLTMCMYWD